MYNARMKLNKDLVAAYAAPLILSILEDGESYGYAILERVRALSDGAVEWTDGMLYPVLHRLERLGYIEGRWGTSETGRKRKYYQLTAAGREQLAAQRAQWQTVDAALRNVWRAVSAPSVLWPLSPLLSPVTSYG